MFLQAIISRAFSLFIFLTPFLQLSTPRADSQRRRDLPLYFTDSFCFFPASATEKTQQCLHIVHVSLYFCRNHFVLLTEIFSRVICSGKCFPPTPYFSHRVFPKVYPWFQLHTGGAEQQYASFLASNSQKCL